MPAENLFRRSFCTSFCASNSDCVEKHEKPLKNYHSSMMLSLVVFMIANKNDMIDEKVDPVVI